jgi:hypothetical protein
MILFYRSIKMLSMATIILKKRGDKKMILCSAVFNNKKSSFYSRFIIYIQFKNH